MQTWLDAYWNLLTHLPSWAYFILAMGSCNIPVWIISRGKHSYEQYAMILLFGWPLILIGWGFSGWKPKPLVAGTVFMWILMINLEITRSLPLRASEALKEGAASQPNKPDTTQAHQ